MIEFELTVQALSVGYTIIERKYKSVQTSEGVVTAAEYAHARACSTAEECSAIMTEFLKTVETARMAAEATNVTAFRKPEKAN